YEDDGGRRLAKESAQLPDAMAREKHRAPRRAETDRAETQHERVCRRSGVDSYLAWSDRSDRRREIARTGGRMDRRGDAHSYLRRSRRDRGDHREARGRGGAHATSV